MYVTSSNVSWDGEASFIEIKLAMTEARFLFETTPMFCGIERHPLSTTRLAIMGSDVY